MAQQPRRLRFSNLRRKPIALRNAVDVCWVHRCGHVSNSAAMAWWKVPKCNPIRQLRLLIGTWRRALWSGHQLEAAPDGCNRFALVSTGSVLSSPPVWRIWTKIQREKITRVSTNMRLFPDLNNHYCWVLFNRFNQLLSSRSFDLERGDGAKSISIFTWQQSAANL